MGGLAVFLILFAGLVGVAATLLLRVRRSRRIGAVPARLQETTAEIRVRIAVLLLIAQVVLASRFGLETILGAFPAGALVGLVDRDAVSHLRFRAKPDAVGYGFLFPILFVASGVRLGLGGLPAPVAPVPLFMGRAPAGAGHPCVALGPLAQRSGNGGIGALQATSLPVIVTATQIGAAAALMSPVTAAALVCAGLLSVAVFPTVAPVLLRRRTPVAAEPVLAAPDPASRRSPVDPPSGCAPIPGGLATTRGLREPAHLA